jgi:hypothetical protein
MYTDWRALLNTVLNLRVPYYSYLGQKLSFQRSSEKEIKRRIGLAWKRFWSLKFILTDKYQNVSLKTEALEKCVIPVLLYGSQTWSLTSKQRQMLRSCQRRMESKILGDSLKDRKKNEEIRHKTGMRDVLNTADRLKWKWGGHVMRLDHTRWTHRLRMWDRTIGKRNVGRQRICWADSFKRIVGAQWTTRPRDRHVWRDLGEVFSE